MNNFLFLLLCALSLSLGCVTTDGDSDGRYDVIEKSKIKEPQWVRRQKQLLIAEGEELESVYCKERGLNLPVEIHAAQQESRSINLELMTDFIAKNAEEKAKNHSITIHNAVDFRAKVRKVLEPLHNEVSRIKDIYYEKLRERDSDDGTSIYRIYVLASFPTGELSKVWKALKADLLKDRDSELKKLSAIIDG